MSEVKKLRVRGREVEVVTRGAPRKPQRPPVDPKISAAMSNLIDAEIDTYLGMSARSVRADESVRAEASDLMDLFDALGEIPEDDLTLGEAIRQLEESESDDG